MPTMPMCSRIPARRPTRPCIWPCCKPGDTILGMSLADGGHLTHGSKVNFSGKLFNAVQYGLDADTGEIDYDQVEALAKEHKPKMIVAGFSAYSRVVDWQRFRDIADSGRCLSVCRYGACGRPGRGRHVPEPGRYRRCHHHHHAQDPARSARRPDPGECQSGDWRRNSIRWCFRVPRAVR